MAWWKIYSIFITVFQLSGQRCRGLVETDYGLVMSDEMAHQALEVAEPLLCRAQGAQVLLTSLNTEERLELLRIMFGQMDLVGDEVSFNKLLVKNITENTGERSFLEPLS